MNWKMNSLGVIFVFVVGANTMLTAQQNLELSPDQEIASMDFVGQHHPDLVHLLERLKTMKRDEYDAALREIQRVRKRLEQLEKRDPLMREVELEGWKIQSQIDLMLARAVVQDKEFDRNLLRPLVEKKIVNQRKHLEAEKAALIARQKQIDETLQRFVATEDDRINQQLMLFLRKIDTKKINTNKSSSSLNVDVNRGTK